MFHGLVRSGLVLAGLLLLGVGLGNLYAGHSKVAQYQELVRTPTVHVPHDPAALFPPASESEERQALARAKVAFYQLLVTVGQFLTATGAALIAIGVLRFWMRAPRAPGPAAAN